MISGRSRCRGSLEHVEQHVAREDVDAHRRDERLVGVVRRERSRRPACSGRSRRAARAFGFSSNATIWPARSNRKMPISVASSAIDRLRGDRDVGVALDVRVDQSRSSPCGRGDRRRGSGSSRRRSARSGAPPGAPRRPCPGTSSELSGVCSAARISTNPSREEVQPVGLRDVPVERRRVELRQHEDAPDVGVQAVADRDVDQPVLAADRHRRLRALLRQRKQPRARGRRRG